MRLFVAVRLADTVVEAAASTARRLHRSLGGRVDARWVAAEHLHVTVRFIGHVPDDRVNGVLDGLRPAFSIEPFDVGLGGSGVFPPSGPPRVIWVGLTKGQASLGAMRLELDRRLAPLGYEAEGRAFDAHLTLARIKNIERAAARPVREAVAALPPVDRQCQVAAATVFQSHLSPAGSTYEALMDIPCAG
jgi:2'-5' RNA ligase